MLSNSDSARENAGQITGLGSRIWSETAKCWPGLDGAPLWPGTVGHDAMGRRRRLERLRAVVLLGGSVRATALCSAIRCSLVDLPVADGRTLLDCWREQCMQLAQALDLRGLPVRLVLDRAASEPRHGWVADSGIMLAVERDPVEYRGTGGVLKDLARCYQPDDYLLVGNAAQLLRTPLTALAFDLADAGGDVAVISHADGTPSGLMLVRCGCLAAISSVGFVDMKEQGLPTIARGHQVRVIERHQPTGLPIRTLGDYIEALRQHHSQVVKQPPSAAIAGSEKAPTQESAELIGLESAWEDWKPVFSLIARPGDVHPQARIHNSVILRGARVDEGAVVVASVVCPGGIVRRGKMVIDQLVTGKRSAEGS